MDKSSQPKDLIWILTNIDRLKNEKLTLEQTQEIYKELTRAGLKYDIINDSLVPIKSEIL